MMRIKALVTGANGMLADALLPLLKKRGYDIIATDIIGETNNMVKLDIRDQKATVDLIVSHNPDLVFHLAAETDVDKCELNQEHAFLTNFQGTEHVILGCKKLDVPLAYISTGAVFDGEKFEGYTEFDKPNPISAYGKSKLKGEEIVASLLRKYFIVRAGWMIGGYHKDKKFVWKITQLLKTKKEISVVTDKMGSPTFTKDFAFGLLKIISEGKYGIYHCVNKGICSRFDIAKKIKEYLNKDDVVLIPVTSAAFPLPAPRGKSEAMLNYKLSQLGIDCMPPWQESLKCYETEVQ